MTFQDSVLSTMLSPVVAMSSSFVMVLILLLVLNKMNAFSPELFDQTAFIIATGK